MASKEPTNKAILQGILAELKSSSESELAFETRTTVSLDHFTEKSSVISALLESANDLGAKTLHVMNDLYTFFTGNDMQQAEDRKELLDVLKSLRGSSVTKSSEGAKVEAVVEKPTSGFLKGLLGFLGISTLAVLGGLVTGFIVESIVQFKRMFQFLNKTFGFAKEGGFLSKMMARVKAFFSEESLIGRGLASIGRAFTAIGTSVKRVIGAIKGIGLALVFDNVALMFVNVQKILGPFWALGSKIGKLLGKLAIPLTVLVGLWDSITGAIEGYKTDGMVGAMKGGLIGLVNSLVGWIFDIPKDIISWMAEKLGYEEVSKNLDDISFKGIFTSIYDWVASVVENIGEWLGKVSVEGIDFSGIWKSVTDTFMWLWDSLITSVKSAFGAAKDTVLKGLGDLSDFLEKTIKSLIGSALPAWRAEESENSPNNLVVRALDAAGLYNSIGAKDKAPPEIAPVKTTDRVSPGLDPIRRRYSPDETRASIDSRSSINAPTVVNNIFNNSVVTAGPDSYFS
jgi:hypothetical protein